MARQSLKDKRILVTGSTGFVGSHLVKKLNLEGAGVFQLSRVLTGKRVLKGNIIEYSTLENFITNNKIQMCIHLAAESLVELGQTEPYKTFKTNIDGTLNILEVARKHGLEKVIVASTVHVYGKNKVPYVERYTPRPSRPYETSKACTDLIAQSYADTFQLPVLIPRFVNIYGPGDLNFSRLIPKTIKSVLHNKSPEMWGGDSIRDYLYIDDVINAYLELLCVPLDKIKGNRIFNFGSGNKASVKEVIQTIINYSGNNLAIKRIDDQRSLEIDEQYVSFAKAKKHLEWEPRTALDHGLTQTLEWYKNYFAKKSL